MNMDNRERRNIIKQKQRTISNLKHNTEQLSSQITELNARNKKLVRENKRLRNSWCFLC